MTPVALLLLICHVILVTSQPRLTCPMRGCSPHGAHALATPLPRHPSSAWSWVGEMTTGDVQTAGRGCTSGIMFVSCATETGYVTLDTTGAVTWNTSDMTSPFLPIVDFFGNAYGSDSDKFSVIYYTGDDSNPLNMSLYRPQFGAAISSSADKNIVVTSSRPAGTPQLVTRVLDGPPYAGVNLTGDDGTPYLPCGDPVFNGTTVYVITRSTSDSQQVKPASSSQGSFRLYAVNLTSNAISWFTDLPDSSRDTGSDQKVIGRSTERSTGSDGVIEAAILVHGGVIYAKYGEGGQSGATLTAIEDQQNTSFVLFSVKSSPGPMAMYDVSATWTNMTVSGLRPVWVLNRSPPLLTAYHPATGHMLSDGADIARLAPAAVGDVTSDLMVARQPNRSDTDVLVFAMQTLEGKAYVVAVEAGLPPSKPKLLWSRCVSGKVGGPGETVTWKVGGQIANMARADDGGWRFGVALTVQERRRSGSRTHVRVLL